MRKLLTVTWMIVIAFAVHAQKRPVQPADILRVATPADPQISPDGGRIAYTLTTIEGDENRTVLWLAELARRTATDTPAAPAPLLPAGWTATTPRWSPDSARLAFIATRADKSGIWVVSLNDATRTPRFVAHVHTTNFHIAYAGESLAWSPDGKQIAYISTEASAAGVNKSTAPLVITRLQYKSRTAFSDAPRTRVFITDVDRPAPRPLTNGDYYDHALTWNPDGREIAFLSNRTPDPEAVNNSDIFAVSLDGETRRITDTKGSEYEPAWSPDGRLIAYTATRRDVTTIDSIAEDAHVWVIDANGRSAGRELTAALDRRARSPRWAMDSLLIFLANDKGRTNLYDVNLKTGRLRMNSLYFARNSQGGETAFFTYGDDTTVKRNATSPLRAARPFQITSLSVAHKSPLKVQHSVDSFSHYPSPLAFVLSDTVTPAEIWFAFGSSAPVQRVSDHNEITGKSIALTDPEQINFNSFDNTPVQGWLMKPANFDASKKYPLILSVHGGPHGMYGYSFNPTFQTYASAGYAVLFLNPRGSNGYGQRFSDGTLKAWGVGDYKDLMVGVDETLRRHTWIDSERLGVTGGSYGGYMTNWIVTQTDRFRAAVAHASVSNLISFYGTSLYQDLIHAEFGGFPWDDYEILWQQSPLKHVARAKTPVLFTHGEADNDVHITQAEEMYTALRRRGVEAVLVRYPGEGHGLRRPANRVDALTRTIEWFDKHLKN